MKKLIAALSAAGLLTFGVAGTALAAEGVGGNDTKASTTTTEPAKPGDGQHAVRRHLRRAAVRVAAQAAAKAIGVDLSALRAAHQGGSSIAAFAESKGVDVAVVKDAIVKALSDKLDQAVTNQKVSAERAAKLKERLPELADRFVNREPGARPNGGSKGTGDESPPSS
jgi:hypothetical protein